MAAVIAGLVILNVVVVVSTLRVRYERDVSRMVFNDNLELLSELRRQTGVASDSLTHLLSAEQTPAAGAYIVVSIEDHKLWYKQGDSVLFETQVATGSGRVLERSGADTHWRFETPRGRLAVVSKEPDPIWIPPDWHYVEQAQARGLGIVRLNRGDRLAAGDGSMLAVIRSDVVRILPDGRSAPLSASEGQEIVAAGNIVIPPFGTNQRKYHGILGPYRLNLGDGYAIHGTNKPETIGQSVSHGCVRVRNEDIARLYETVPLGTPVYIY